MEIFIDVGQKNFCWVKYDCEKNIVDSFDLVEVKSINDVTKILNTFENPINIEMQLSKNNICKRYEHHVESYCNIKNIKFQKINPKIKFKKLNEERPNSHYKRKQKAIEIGKKMISEKKIDCPEINFKKQDDIFDCILMGYTKYL